MSWDSYVESMNGQGAYSCCIYERKTGAICCQSKLNLQQAEGQMIEDCIAGRNTQLAVGGEPCVMTNSSKDEWVEGKTKAACADGNKIFYHIEFSANFAVIVGKTGAAERTASTVASNIAAHLKSSGI